MANYRLMDRSQNSSVGSRMAQNIERLRDRLSKDSGDPAWLTCDITFTDVKSERPEQRDIWTQHELIAGGQIDAFIRLGRPKC